MKWVLFILTIVILIIIGIRFREVKESKYWILIIAYWYLASLNYPIKGFAIPIGFPFALWLAWQSSKNRKVKLGIVGLGFLSFGMSIFLY